MRDDGKVLAAVIIFAILLLATAIVIATDPPWNWGDVPTWVGAVTTLAAFLAAAYVVKIELGRDARALALDSDRRLALERAEQADSIAAWPDRMENVEPGRKLSQWINPRDWTCVLQNASLLPIYAVRITLGPPDAPSVQLEERGLVPPGRHPMGWPGELAPITDGHDVKVEIEFRDAAGRLWRRDIHGVLKKMGDADLPATEVRVARVALKVLAKRTKPAVPDR